MTVAEEALVTQIASPDGSAAGFAAALWSSALIGREVEE